MKAIWCKAFEGPESLAVGEAEAPTPAEHEVVLAVKAASVNYMDLLLVSGLYQMKPPLPFIAGTDAAGEVVAVGTKVTRFRPGDRVAAFHWTGAFAERMAAEESRTMHLPDPIDYPAGSAILHSYVSAFYALEQGGLKPGETLLVNGAAGGVGMAAVDLGRHLGARVIGTVGSPEKADPVRAQGAGAVIDYSGENLRERVRELTGDSGADVILDTVGGDVFDQSIRCIAWNGRLVVVGFTSGRIPQLPLNLPLLKNCAVMGVSTGAWAGRYPEENLRVSETVLAWVAEGRLHPHVSRVMELESAREALQELARRKSTGKIVLRVE